MNIFKDMLDSNAAIEFIKASKGSSVVVLATIIAIPVMIQIGFLGIKGYDLKQVEMMEHWFYGAMISLIFSILIYVADMTVFIRQSAMKNTTD